MTKYEYCCFKTRLKISKGLSEDVNTKDREYNGQTERLGTKRQTMNDPYKTTQKSKD